MNNFVLNQFGSEATGLFNDVRNMFNRSNNSAIKILTGRVPTSFVNEGTPLKIVFAGQYSAGKSTILSFLTGQKLKVGGGITTQQLHKLNWNGVTVYDTPGIHTELRPDHDKITYDAIAEADLVVFIMTGKGFDEHLGSHFRKLLVDKGKGNEMMLVANKMEDTELGNTQEQIDYFKVDIEKVIEPEYSLNDLYTTYIDARSYNEAMVETNPRERERKLRISGYQNLIENLNRFIGDKNLLGRCTSNLYLLEQLLTEAMSNYTTGDENLDMARQYLTRNRRVVSDARDRIRDNSFMIVRKNTSQVKQWGNDMANTLSEKDTEESLNSRLSSKYNQVNMLPERITKELERMIEQEAQRINQDVDQINSSQFGEMFFETAQEAMQNTHIRKDTVHKMSNAGSKVSEFGRLVSQWSTGPNAVTGLSNFAKLGNFSGSQTHEMVLKVGHFFGKKFVPWEAVKWARGIGVAGKCLGIAGSIIGIFVQASNDHADEKMALQLQEGRSKIRSSFDQAADAIDMEFDQRTGEWVEKVLNPRIQDIDNKINQIDSLVQNQNAEYQQLSNLLQRTRSLISQIQRV